MSVFATRLKGPWGTKRTTSLVHFVFPGLNTMPQENGRVDMVGEGMGGELGDWD